jgi:hypothetical protein
MGTFINAEKDSCSLFLFLTPISHSLLNLYQHPWCVITDALTFSRNSRFHRGEAPRFAALWFKMMIHVQINLTLLRMSTRLDNSWFRELMFCLTEKQNSRSKPNVPVNTHKYNYALMSRVIRLYYTVLLTKFCKTGDKKRQSWLRLN